MESIIDWLKTRLGLAKPEPEESPWGDSPHVRPRPPRVRPKPNAASRPEPVDFSADVGGRIIDGGPGKNVLIRNKYVREDTGTHETLKIVDDSLLETDEEFGADPYNTGRFDRSKSWDSFRTRK
jgi:hypothetical protein